MRRWIIATVAILTIATLPGVHVHAASNDELQAQIDADNAQIEALTKKIAEYQAALQQIGADKKTLQDAIKALDLQRSKIQAQVTITQRKINTTQVEIKQLGDQISDTEQAILHDKDVLAVYLRTIQRSDNQAPAMETLLLGDISEFWGDLATTLTLQDKIRERVDTLRAQQQTLTDTQTTEQQKRDILTAQQQTLTAQQRSLTSTVQSKNHLLAETKAQESTYQKLLAAAQKELESYTTFTQNAGGAGLLPHRVICDNWGCYYNQRDALWGNSALNGTKYTLASDGCLVTAMAMVMTHYGYTDVTPLTINSNPGNFASYYPAFLLTTINVDGVSATRVTATIDAVLATGHPVIVGVHAYGGTHFVVLVSGSGGKYTMRDPYLENGKDASFSGSYSLKQIYKIQKVTIS